MIYPWQQSLWQSLADAPLAAALLLAGRLGTGKLAFARSLAKRVLCEIETSCGDCESCRWFEHDVHPDYYLLEPEPEESETQGSRTIKIEQVRALKEKITVASAGARVIVVHPAEAMNANAQNALLKVLEEPPPLVLFILVSHRPHALLPTVLSRCQRINMPVPPAEQAANWLRQQGVDEHALAWAGGAPLLAVAAAEHNNLRLTFLKHLNDAPNPIALAQIFQRYELTLVVDWLQRWTYDVMLYQVRKKIRYHVDCEKQIASEARRFPPKALHRFQRELIAAAGLIGHPLRSDLFMEQLSFSYWRHHG
jgi:DNA polymerase-3 subunit delta'